MSKEHLIIFDTTMRDGEQIARRLHDARTRSCASRAQLERLQVDVIEAGFAGLRRTATSRRCSAIASAIKDSTVCSLCARQRPRHRARRRSAEGRAIARASTPSSPPAPLHMEKKLRMTPEQVLEQAKLVGALRAQALPTTSSSRPRTASRSRRRLPLPRARGGDRRRRDHDQHPRHRRLRGARAVRRTSSADLRERIPNSDKAIWSVHCHNDLGMAVANSLAGVKIGGARQVECTINGLGERAGNCSLEEVVMAVKTRSGLLRPRRRHRHDADRAGVAAGVADHRLRRCSRTRRWWAPTPSRTPRGIHQDGVLKARDTYEIMRAEDVGWSANKIVLGKLSGRNAFKQRLKELGIELESRGATSTPRSRASRSSPTARARSSTRTSMALVRDEAVGARERALPASSR